MKLHIDRQAELIDAIAWQGSLEDNLGNTIATYAGPSAYDVMFAAARDADQHAAAMLEADASNAPLTPEGCAGPTFPCHTAEEHAGMYPAPAASAGQYTPEEDPR